MTHLTLHWHLRTIVQGTPDDAYTTGSGEHAPTDGHVCDCYDKTMAIEALNSDDAVAFLDSVAHDPCVPMQRRFDAETLLAEHIMERRLICLEEKRYLSARPTDEEVKMKKAFQTARKSGDLPKPSMKSSYWTPAECPTCGGQETLFDVDQPDSPNHCTVCGTEIPIPEYPC